jgi:hypothetical protein
MLQKNRENLYGGQIFGYENHFEERTDQVGQMHGISSKRLNLEFKGFYYNKILSFHLNFSNSGFHNYRQTEW